MDCNLKKYITIILVHMKWTWYHKSAILQLKRALFNLTWGYANTMTIGRWGLMARGNNRMIRRLEFSESLLNFHGGERRDGLELITNAQWLNQLYLCNGTSIKLWNNGLCSASELVKKSTCLEGDPNSTGPDAPVIGTLLVLTLGTSSPGCSFASYIITR